MSIAKAIVGSVIFDGQHIHRNSALIVSEGNVMEIVDQFDIPSNCQTTQLEGGMLVPGFLDLQVNGGGGVLFNEKPEVDTIRTMCQAHARYGTTGMLPTLITDTPQITTKAIAAAIRAKVEGVPGFLGLHLEGPHLSRARKGAHDPTLIRQMTDEDLQQLLYAKQNLPHLMVTLAPESVTLQQISTLSKAGLIVSLGHSDTSFTIASDAFDAGARCATHLYNAMSPLTHREPGLVGAVLARGGVYAGLIADGHHVKPAAISIALAAKKSPGQIFLVTDAMSTIGTDMKSFTLNDRTIYRKAGRLELQDGTLSGADLDMSSALRYMHDVVGLDRLEAIRMASLYPARCIGADDHYGHLKPGAFANMTHLNDKNHTLRTRWKGTPFTVGS
jgi:N-acetylglucosamine-6-phosphate deacetylase